MCFFLLLFQILTMLLVLLSHWNLHLGPSSKVVTVSLLHDPGECRFGVLSGSLVTEQDFGRGTCAGTTGTEKPLYLIAL